MCLPFLQSFSTGKLENSTESIPVVYFLHEGVASIYNITVDYCDRMTSLIPEPGLGVHGHGGDHVPVRTQSPEGGTQLSMVQELLPEYWGDELSVGYQKGKNIFPNFPWFASPGHHQGF